MVHNIDNDNDSNDLYGTWIVNIYLSLISQIIQVN